MSGTVEWLKRHAEIAEADGCPEEAGRLLEAASIVRELPVTADSQPVWPGRYVYCVQDGEVREVCATLFYRVTGDWWLNDGMYDYCIRDECYAERESAEEAAKCTE